MTIEMKLKLGFSLMIGIASAIFIMHQSSAEKKHRKSTLTDRMYRPYMNPWMLPAFMFAIGIFSVCTNTFRMGRTWFSGVMFEIVVLMAVYYLILIPAGPFLRKHFRASVCAFFWCIPGELYILLTAAGMIFTAHKPLLIVYLERPVYRILLSVWIIGTAGILIWKITEHFLFRRYLFKDAVPVSDPVFIKIWDEERERVGETGGRLVISPKARTPLAIGSIGFSRKRVTVILPDREYTPDELHMIFRHELIHMQRDDAGNKFLLVFLAALGWFNPLLWIAMRKSAEDIELGCDEEVLENAGEEKRKQYAELLLRVPGDERGFTTCLSAKAKSLRYRLRNVVRPCPKRSGAILVGILSAAMIFASGNIRLAAGGESLGNIVSEKLGTPCSEKLGDISELRLYQTVEQTEENSESSEAFIFIHDPKTGSGVLSESEAKKQGIEDDLWTYTEEHPGSTAVVLVIRGKYVEITRFEEGVSRPSYYYILVKHD